MALSTPVEANPPQIIAIADYIAASRAAGHEPDDGCKKCQRVVRDVMNADLPHVSDDREVPPTR